MIDYAEEIFKYFEEAVKNNYPETLIRMDLQRIISGFEKEIDEYWEDCVEDLKNEIEELKEGMGR